MGPVLLDCSLQSVSGTVASIYVGHLLGARDLAATSSFFPVLLMLVSCSVGLGTGAGVLVGQYWGAKQSEQARVVMGAALGVGLLTGLCIAVGGQYVIRPVMELFGTPPVVLDDAVSYAATLLAGAPALGLVIICAIVLRGTGDNVRPLLSMGIQIGTMLLVCPLAIRAGWGLQGVALTAIAGWVVALCWLGISLRRAGHPCAPDRTMLRLIFPRREVLFPVLRLGLPAMAEIMAMGLAEVALVGRINAFGAPMAAAYGLLTQTLTYIEYPGMAVGITVSVMCAQAIGARNEAGARAVLRTGFIIGLIMTGIMALAVTLLPGTVASFFTSDTEVKQLSEHAFRCVMWSAVPLSLGGVLGAAMRAAGNVVAPMAILLGCIFCVELPVGYLAAREYGSWGVWLGYPASFSSMFLMTGLYWLVWWRHKKLVPVI